eukprot:13221897-Alexandrium_andersonii.AAC.1
MGGALAPLHGGRPVPRPTPPGGSGGAADQPGRHAGRQAQWGGRAQAHFTATGRRGSGPFPAQNSRRPAGQAEGRGRQAR